MFPQLETTRFTTETGYTLAVEAPEERVDAVLEAILSVAPLTWGDYDRVAFRGAAGVQQFRSLGTGRNAGTPNTMAVPCQRVTCFLPGTADVAAVLEAVFHVHPYEEPVIVLIPALRTLHVRGRDEDNPNRFWNRPASDWVPEAPR